MAVRSPRVPFDGGRSESFGSSSSSRFEMHGMQSPRGKQALNVEEQRAVVSELREGLARERENTTIMQQRAEEAEYIAVWLKEELDKELQEEKDQELQAKLQNLHLKQQRWPVSADGDLDGTRQVRRVDVSKCSMPASAALLGAESAPQSFNHAIADGTVDDHSDDIAALEENLRQLQQQAAVKEMEVASLTEKSVALREELNEEKKRVIELKRAENENKGILEKASGDLELNQLLQEEASHLRADVARLTEQVKAAGPREQELQDDLAYFKKHMHSTPDLNVEEMEHLSVAVSGQLVAVERELAERTKELSELTDPFLQQAHGLLASACSACAGLDTIASKPHKPPPLFDPRSRDLRNTMEAILKLLYYIVKVLASRAALAEASPRSRRTSNAGASPRIPEPRRERDPDKSISKRWSCYLAG